MHWLDVTETTLNILIQGKPYTKVIKEIWFLSLKIVPDPDVDSDLLPVYRSDRVCGCSVVHFLPHHCPADAEEIPQVAEDATVKRVLLAFAVLQVWDPVTWHELPGGAVDRDQVEVAAQQQPHHHRENTDNPQRRQQEPVDSEPQLPGDAGRDARPEK